MKFGNKELKNVKDIPDYYFLKFYKNFARIYTDFGTYAVLAECVDVYTDKNLLYDIKKSIQQKLNDSEIAQIGITLSTYPTLSFMEKERLEFLKLCLLKKQDFEYFSEKYFWIQNNYLKPISVFMGIISYVP